MSDSAIVTFALIAAIAGIAYGLYLAMWVFRLSPGNAKMQEIAKAIQEGAGAYMNRQYKTVGVVAAVLFVVLWAAGAVSDKFGMLTAVGFLVGAGASSLAGYVGMITANSFMKREFGKKLIEEFFPRIDLTHVIDTSGAYIPGHGTPTVILFGRHRRPVKHEVRAVLGIRGDRVHRMTRRRGKCGGRLSSILSYVVVRPSLSV